MSNESRPNHGSISAEVAAITQNELAEAKKEAEEVNRRANELAESLHLPIAEAADFIIAEDFSMSELKTQQGNNLTIGSLALLNTPRKPNSSGLVEAACRVDIRPPRGLRPLFQDNVRENTDQAEVQKYIEGYISNHHDVLAQYHIEDLHKLTPIQATLLSAHIVCDSLQYDFVCLGDKSRALAQGLELSGDQDFKQLSAERNDLLDRQMGVQDILADGSGVCRHYAHAFEGVFRTLKGMQEDNTLDGTDTLYVGTTPGLELDTDNHAYNLVLSQQESGELLALALDTTWSDRRFAQANDRQWRDHLDYYCTRLSSAISTLDKMGILDKEDAEERLQHWALEKPQEIFRIMNLVADQTGGDRSFDIDPGREKRIIDTLEDALARQTSAASLNGLLHFEINQLIKFANMDNDFAQLAEDRISQLSPLSEQLTAEEMMRIPGYPTMIAKTIIFQTNPGAFRGIFQNERRGGISLRYKKILFDAAYKIADFIQDTPDAVFAEKLRESAQLIGSSSLSDLASLAEGLRSFAADPSFASLPEGMDFMNAGSGLRIEKIRWWIGELEQLAKETGQNPEEVEALADSARETLGRLEKDKSDYDQIVFNDIDYLQPML